MNAKFKAFARSDVIDAMHRDLFSHWAGVKDAIVFLEQDRKYRAYFTFIRKLCDRVAKKCGPDWTPAEFTRKLVVEVERIENSSRLQIVFIDPAKMKLDVARMDPGVGGKPAKLTLRIPNSRRRKSRVLISAFELNILFHEFCHFLISMGNGEPSVNQSLHWIKCLHKVMKMRDSRDTREDKPWALVEMLCESGSLILLEAATRHMVLKGPFYTDFPCKKPNYRKRPGRGAYCFVLFQ